MLGGLYGDLPPPSDEDTATATATSSVWSTSAKMAPPTLRKPSALIPPPQTILKPAHSRPKPAPPAQTQTQIHHHQPAPAPSSDYHPSPVVVVEEYDPARPNDYEDYKKEKKKHEREAAERKRRLIEDEERERREKEAAEKREKNNKRNAERELNISGEEAWRRRAAMSGGPSSPPPTERGEDDSGNSNNNGFSIGKSESGGLGIGAGGQMSAAQRMMAKMGWKQGQGLGKQEQGITTPLMAKKTDRRAGVIVNASENKQPPEKKVKSVNLSGQPTRVLLLRNMVGPGEVDDELEVEVGEECAKYGKVTRVLIFEITEPNFPSDEAVRIFVQFERSEETTKALIDLDGRFFGGRVVKAGFYEEERFNKNELAPMPGEIPGF